MAGNRLKVWQEHRYQYDIWGNCIEKKSGKHQVQHYTWDAEHQLVAVQTENQSQDLGQQAHWCYAYDPFGRRIAKWQVLSETSKTSERQVPQQLTHFTWDGNRLLAEYTQTFTDQVKLGATHPLKHKLYLYEPESFVPLAQTDSLWNAQEDTDDKLSSNFFLQEVMQQARNDEKFWNEKVLPLQRKLRSKLKSLDESPKPLQSRIYYVHTDHLGTPRELTNSAGDIVWAAHYKAWGATANIEFPLTQQTLQVGNTVQKKWVQALAEEVPVQNLRFQGQYFDVETGLHYNRFRYYDPDCGRFVSQDPIGITGGVNLYFYARNPVNFIDPFGLTGTNIVCQCECKTLAEWLKDHPDLLQETRDEFKRAPQWQGIDPDKTPVFYRTQDEVKEIRKKAAERAGHHPHGLALGGPKGQKLTTTNETIKCRSEDHNKATGLQRRIINVIKGLL